LTLWEKPYNYKPNKERSYYDLVTLKRRKVPIKVLWALLFSPDILGRGKGLIMLTLKLHAKTKKAKKIWVLVFRISNRCDLKCFMEAANKLADQGFQLFPEIL
jgi:hypothetical protein